MTPLKMKRKLKFGKVSTIHIPFIPPIGMVDELYQAGIKSLEKFEVPKGTKSQTISIEIHWSKDGMRDYQLTQASIHKF